MALEAEPVDYDEAAWSPFSFTFSFTAGFSQVMLFCPKLFLFTINDRL